MAQARQLNRAHGCTHMASHLKVLPAGRMLSCQGHLLPLCKNQLSVQDSKLWGPHPLVNFLDLWKSTLTLKHLLDAFGQSSGAHRSCVLGSQVQHGMLSGCNVKRGQIQVEGKKNIYIYIYI